MKKLIAVNNNNSELTNIALLVARVAVAALMLTHGLPKLAQFFQAGPVSFVPFMGLSPAISLALAVFAEVVAVFVSRTCYTAKCNTTCFHHVCSRFLYSPGRSVCKKRISNYVPGNLRSVVFCR
jgi:hypothetical protein